MGVSVSLVAVQLGLFTFFAVKCAAIYAVLRRETALAWITGALMLGAVYMVIYALWPSDRVEQLATIIVTPLSFYCIAQSVRLLAHQPPPDRRLWTIITILAALECLMIIAGVPFLFPMALFQATIFAGAVSCIGQVWRARPRHRLDWPLMAGLAILATVFLVRVPAWLLSAPAGTSYQALRALPADVVLLTVGAITSSIVAVLLAARGLSDLYVDLRERSERDGLTGLYNRAAFDQRVEQQACAGSLVLADIDHFKSINDRYGHALGDGVIRSMARMLRDSGRLCARVGGEEFVLWVPGDDPREAQDLANRLRRMLQSRSHSGLAEGHALTASFGVAWVDAGDSLIDGYHRADAALYRAKEAGRDRVELCPVAGGLLAA